MPLMTSFVPSVFTDCSNNSPIYPPYCVFIPCITVIVAPLGFVTWQYPSKDARVEYCMSMLAECLYTVHEYKPQQPETSTSAKVQP